MNIERQTSNIEVLEENKKRITSFRDLEVYQNTYKAMLEVMKEIVPK